MTFPEKPRAKPARAEFSSGPCPKHPEWSVSTVASKAFLGRSHRASAPKAQLKAAVDRTAEMLGVPDGYKVGIVPASDTGAVEMAMWSMLGACPVDVLVWESFGAGWATGIQKQLKLDDVNVLKADYGQLPDLGAVRKDADVVFTWNGTTSGVRIPNADWIKPNPDRVVICDATSAVFAQDIEWEKLDVVTYSWQKVLGGEAAHGMLILSPNAVARLESYKPDRPLPKLFRMTKGGKLNEALFEGNTINTPSMLCTEDYLQALDWAEECGGYQGLKARSDRSLQILTDWVAKTDWVEFLCADDDVRSNTGVTLSLVHPTFVKMDEPTQRDFIKRMMKRLETEDACFDANGYAKAPPGLRIWCGATVEPDDVAKLTPWLDWTFAEELAAL